MALPRDFAPRVQLFARLCPMTIIKDEVLRALVDFCRISGIWKHSSINDLAAGVDTYSPLLPTGAAIGTIESVAVGGSPLPPVPYNWPSDGAQAAQASFYMVDQDKAVRLYPAPSEAAPGALVVNAVLEPAFNAVTVPDFLYQQHRDAIVSGAISTVAAMVGQPWANPQLALFHMQNFKREIAKVRIATLKSNSLGTLTITAQPL